MKLGQNESEILGLANMMNERIVPCTALQDPEVEQVIRFFPGPETVVYRSDRESESPETDAPWKTILSERTRTHSFSTQRDERPWTDGDPKGQRLWLWVDEIECYICSTRRNFCGKGHNEITLHDVNLLSMSKSFWKWAKIVSDLEGIQELKKELVLDHSRFGMDGVITQLQTNLKTHKPPGQVKLRAIHSTTKNPSW